MNNTAAQSIFDIIEEAKVNQREFIWSRLPQDLFYNPLEILHEGTLLINEPSGEQNSSKYILTVQGLYKCKVTI